MIWKMNALILKCENSFVNVMCEYNIVIMIKITNVQMAIDFLEHSDIRIKTDGHNF